MVIKFHQYINKTNNVFLSKFTMQYFTFIYKQNNITSWSINSISKIINHRKYNVWTFDDTGCIAVICCFYFKKPRRIKTTSVAILSIGFVLFFQFDIDSSCNRCCWDTFCWLGHYGDRVNCGWLTSRRSNTSYTNRLVFVCWFYIHNTYNNCWN